MSANLNAHDTIIEIGLKTTARPNHWAKHTRSIITKSEDHYTVIAHDQQDFFFRIKVVLVLVGLGAGARSCRKTVLQSGRQGERVFVKSSAPAKAKREGK